MQLQQRAAQDNKQERKNTGTFLPCLRAKLWNGGTMNQESRKDTQKNYRPLHKMKNRREMSYTSGKVQKEKHRNHHVLHIKMSRRERTH